MEEKTEKKTNLIFRIIPYLAGVCVFLPFLFKFKMVRVESEVEQSLWMAIGGIFVFIEISSLLLIVIFSVFSYFQNQFKFGIRGFIILLTGALFFKFAIPTFAPNPTRAKVSRVKMDMRDARIALHVFYSEHGYFPDWAIGKDSQNSGIQGAENSPCFRVQFYYKDTSPTLTLTTPIDYITNYPIDPFLNNKNNTATFAYYSQNDSFLLYSCGPDKDYDIEIQNDFKNGKNRTESNLIIKSYDPTNGTFSNGDIYWLHWEE